jgi:hypothetical protein
MSFCRPRVHGLAGHWSPASTAAPEGGLAGLSPPPDWGDDVRGCRARSGHDAAQVGAPLLAALKRPSASAAASPRPTNSTTFRLAVRRQTPTRWASVTGFTGARASAVRMRRSSASISGLSLAATALPCCVASHRVNRSLQNTTVDDAVGGKAVVRGRPTRHGSRAVCQGDLGSWPPDDETGLQIFSID